MKHRYGKTSALMTALVFVVFAICVMMVLLMGAGVYKRLVERGEAQFSDRIPAQYLSTRIRQAQWVTIGDFQGSPALELWEESEGEAYVTRVYLYEGAIRELYSEADAILDPEDGEQILEAGALEFAREGQLLRVLINDRELVFHLRTGKEALP